MNSLFCKTNKFLVGLILLNFQGKAQSPAASFSMDVNTGCSPYSVQFTNTSTNAVSYYWNFGNGNTSTLVNPSNVYTSPGAYTVTLVAFGASGAKDTLTMVNAINAQGKPTTDFYAQNTSACLAGNFISFVNTSIQSTYWLWDFGDGNTSNLQNPSHSYNSSGYYTVTLIAGNSSFCEGVVVKLNYIHLFNDWNADFTVDADSSCDINRVFTFIGQSIEITSYSWDFGDGTTSNLPNPAHTYTAPGQYTVTLSTVNTNGCTDTQVKLNFITISNGDQPAITANQSSGCVPLSVSFDDNGLSSSTWFWNFGDGNASSLKNPVHIYDNPGIYDLSLSIANGNGCLVTAILVNYINVQPAPTADFEMINTSGCSPLAVEFNNLSTGDVSWLWSFGDGNTSTQEHPLHFYNNAGNFHATLTAFSNNSCMDTFYIADTIKILDPVVNFNSNISSGCVPLPVAFTQVSINADQWLWDFGDGATSSDPNPNHSYLLPGNYEVKLIAANSLGCSDTLTMPSLIQAQYIIPDYVIPTPFTACAPLDMSFTDYTANASGWEWDFGDGTPAGTGNNAGHLYENPGQYNVSLTIDFDSACSLHIPNYIAIIINTGSSDFSYTPDICWPKTLSFSSTSTGAVSWNWDFGDNTGSNSENPVHTYSVYGRYVVVLEVTTATGCNYKTSKIVSVLPNPPMAEPYFFTSDSIYPMTASFYGNPSGATSWFWDFGDGFTSTEENPTHFYPAPPQYDIQLIVSNGACNDTFSIEMQVVLAIPGFFNELEDEDSEDTIINFSMTGCSPLNVYFNNEFPGSLSYYWDFGDGESSNLENPSHLYESTGIFDITFSALQPGGGYDSLLLDDFITIAGVKAGFTTFDSMGCDSIIISFLDTSINATQWLWDFGDGATSILQNPVHSYPLVNTIYNIILQVEGDNGCSDTKTTSIYTGVNTPQFLYNDTVCVNDTWSIETSLNTISSWNWNFGDGSYSTAASPNHLYVTGGTFNITLTTVKSNGCVNYYSLPTPVTVLNPVSGFTIVGSANACDTLSVMLNNTSSNAISYSWDFGNGTTSTSANPTVFYNSPGVYTISLKSSNAGCENTATQDSVVIIYEANADFSFTQSSYCLPVTASMVDASSVPVSWFWDFGNGAIDIQQNPVHVFDSLPASGISLTITDTNGCTSTVTKPSINIVAADFNVNLTDGCVPLSVSFTAGSSIPVTWNWDFGDGSVSSINNPVHTYADAGNYTVTLTVQSSDGCMDTVKNDEMIHAHKPIADFFSPVPAQCSPSVVSYFNQSQNALSYNWNFGDGSGSSNPNPIHIYTIPGLYSIQLTATDGYGCADTMIKQSYTSVLGPIAFAAGSYNQGCQGLNVIFSDQSTGAASWSWNFGDGNSSELQNPQHKYEDYGTFAVSLIVEDMLGCSSLFLFPDSVIVHPSPIANFSVPDTVSCTPYYCQFTNNSEFSDVYLWNYGIGGTIYGQNVSYVYDSAGIYQTSLIAINSFGCIDTLRKTITVNQSPNAEFESDIQAGCYPLQVNITSLSSGLVDPEFSWDFQDGFLSIEENPSVVFTTQGYSDVTFIVANANGCSDTVSKPGFIEVFDTLPPAEPMVNTVTVESNSVVKIAWKKTDINDFASYIIYRQYPGAAAFTPVAILENQNSNEFLDLGLNTLQNSYCYKIQVVDTCGNMEKLDSLTAYCTINISSETFADKVELEWTAYSGCPVQNYEIYRDGLNGMAPVLVASVPDTQLLYTDLSLICPVKYSYRIKATSLCGTDYFSMSDTTVSGPIENIFEGQKVDVVRSTVVDNRYILTEWKKPAIKPQYVTAYNIFRSAGNGQFVFINSVPAYGLQYMDEEVDISRQNYLYKIEVANVCEVMNDPGKRGSSILLQAELIEETPNLFWTPYQDWEQGVEYYLVEKLNDRGEWEIIQKVDKEVNSIIDDGQ